MQVGEQVSTALQSVEALVPNPFSHLPLPQPSASGEHELHIIDEFAAQ